MSANASNKVEKTLKMQAHQASTAICAVAMAATTGLVTHANTLSACDDAAPAGTGDVILTAAGIMIASFAVAYFTRPIPVETEGLERTKGVAYR